MENSLELDIWSDDEIPDSPLPAIDLWSDDAVTPEEPTSNIMPEVSPGEIVFTVDEKNIYLFTKEDLSENKYFNNLLGVTESENESSTKQYTMRLGPLNCFVLRYMNGYKNIIGSEVKNTLAEYANKVEAPVADLTEDRKHLQVSVPNISYYRELLKKVNGYPTRDGHRVDISRALDLETMSETSKTRFPKIKFTRDVLQLNREPIIGFDGTLESLKEIPVESLNIIQANNQNWKNLQKSKLTLTDKIKSMGIESLYDLLFWVPRRYIDKSQPQEIENLIEGENAVIVGKIVEKYELKTGRGGSVFVIETSRGRKIRTTFFNQKWLYNKFNVENEVLVTGKMTWYMRKPQIAGNSIEHADEAAVLPIVPIYKQSVTKGITTHLLMTANRELLSRIGDIKLPPYLKQNGRMDYWTALNELHFPSSIKNHFIAVNTLAYYELVYMQILIQDAKNNSVDSPGLVIGEGYNKLQAKALNSLGFELTKSQKIALVKMNKKFADSKPSSTLINADVGAGKTIIAQASCLRAVDAGFQAVLIGPTEILAQQLFEGFKKLLAGIEEKFGNKVSIEYLGKSTKVRENKEILKRIEDGQVSIIVGTGSVLSDSLKYFNLGFIAIDEQQKFGAEQRSKLLMSRSDGHVPDIMMLTATPIPRTTAQVFYGDVDMIELKEKPAGRLPIITEWIQENPMEIIEDRMNSLWGDVINEAEDGHQTFIITPLVDSSEKIEAASVEKTFKSLSTGSLSSLRVASVHGKMKADDQKIIMQAFKDREYDVLIASTVVEVGVDIPMATRVVVLSADRLGSSSLHQIRGRVGRNSLQSKCYIVSDAENENSQLRLQSLVDNDNGFDIAKDDLELRGEGTMFSTDQAGKSEMIFANLSKHREKIDEAKEEAARILKSPFRAQAIKDGQDKFNSEERMI